MNLLHHPNLERLPEYLASIGMQVNPESLPLYAKALTHSSYTYEFKLSSLDNYERLEFLGDAVLKLIVSDYLYHRFNQYREGELTKIRAVIVSDAFIGGFAKAIGLQNLIILGPSELRSGGADRASNLACAFESFIGAMYIDGQYDFARQFLQDLIADAVTRVDLSKTKDNYKAVLQELTQAEAMGLPDYKTAEESGPPHNRRFVVDVYVGGELLGRGTGHSKKEAQQQAAKMALQCMNEPVDDALQADGA